jgi:hypothetical protein
VEVVTVGRHIVRRSTVSATQRESSALLGVTVLAVRIRTRLKKTINKTLLRLLMLIIFEFLFSCIILKDPPSSNKGK